MSFPPHAVVLYKLQVIKKDEVGVASIRVAHMSTVVTIVHLAFKKKKKLSIHTQSRTRAVLISHTFFFAVRQESRLRLVDNTSQKDFGTRKVYCVSNVTFHAESKCVIKIFPSPTVFVQWPF